MTNEYELKAVLSSHASNWGLLLHSLSTENLTE